MEDKLKYRYPRGESYLDLIQRIEPIIYEIERSKDPVIIIAHQAVLRCLYAYFARNEIPEVPHIDIPLHTVIKLVPETYYCHETRYTLDLTKKEWKEKVVIKTVLIDDIRPDKEGTNPIFSPYKDKAFDSINSI